SAKSLLVQRHFKPKRARVGQYLLAAWPLSRMVANAIAAVVMHSNGHARSAAVWREVWIRRGEWFEGYQDRHRRGRSLTPADAATRVG
ncbi:MAG: hypothetical protein AAFY64_02080, partial [Pseudomonadota bacterium]